MYNDLIHNIEKIGDSCDNIAEAVLNDVNISDAKIMAQDA
jgi:phosphate uptake regulator